MITRTWIRKLDWADAQIRAARESGDEGRETFWLDMRLHALKQIARQAKLQGARR